MSTQQLSFSFVLHSSHNAEYETILSTTQEIARTFLANEYWTDEHLHRFTEQNYHNRQNSYNYISQAEYNPFEEYYADTYYYNRYKRCVSQKITRIFAAHADEYLAFKEILQTCKENLIKRVGMGKLRQKVFKDDSDTYVNWNSVQQCVDKLNQYYKKHGEFPKKYTELVNTPRPNGTLPFSPDDTSIHSITHNSESQQLRFTLNIPDETASKHQDWDEISTVFNTTPRFEQFAKNNQLGKPTLHKQDMKNGHPAYVLDIPIKTETLESDTVNDRVLACDLGVKTQVTSVILEDTGDDSLLQHSQPDFINHENKQKLFRLASERESLSNTIAQLADTNRQNTEYFNTVYQEHKQVARKERNLRYQIQHDLTNQLILIALETKCDKIVLEDLASLDAPAGKHTTSRSITTWARGDFKRLLEYKAELVGISVAYEPPYKTSRTCPRCGSDGVTIKAPDNPVETRDGGWFSCTEADCQCNMDRDYTGALNIGRLHLSDSWRLGRAKPTAYIDVGQSYASFPTQNDDDKCNQVVESMGGVDRFTGVRPQRVNAREWTRQDLVLELTCPSKTSCEWSVNNRTGMRRNGSLSHFSTRRLSCGNLSTCTESYQK